MESLSRFESDLFDDSDTPDALHESTTLPLSLYEHLSRLLTQFDTCCDSNRTRMTRAQVDQLARDRAVRTVAVRGPEEVDCEEPSLVDALLGTPPPVLPSKGTTDFYSTTKYDYACVQSADHSVCQAARPLFLTILRYFRSVLFSSPKPTTTSSSSQAEVEYFKLGFYITTTKEDSSSEDPNVDESTFGPPGKRILTIEDAAFYSEEWLTLVLSDPKAPPQKNVNLIGDESKLDGGGDQDGDDVVLVDEEVEKRDDGQNETQDMSMMNDSEMFSENDDPEDPLPTTTDPPATATPTTTTPSDPTSTLPPPLTQYLVQLRYDLLFEHMSTVCPEELVRVPADSPDKFDLLNATSAAKVKLVHFDLDKLIPKEEDEEEKAEEEGMEVDDSGEGKISVEDLLTVRPLGEGFPTKLAVSGTRKLACLFQCPRTRLSIFEMDVPEEEAEEEEQAEEVQDEEEEEEGNEDDVAAQVPMQADDQEVEVASHVEVKTELD